MSQVQFMYRRVLLKIIRKHERYSFALQRTQIKHSFTPCKSVLRLIFQSLRTQTLNTLRSRSKRHSETANFHRVCFNPKPSPSQTSIPCTNNIQSKQPKYISSQNTCCQSPARLTYGKNNKNSSVVVFLQTSRRTELKLRSPQRR